MRIRQVKPAFWTDDKVAKLSYPARLYWIGLWNIADDAGWLSWQPERIGAELFPYESPPRRLRNLAKWTVELTTQGLLIIDDCCAVIPHMPDHQRITGRQTFTARDDHRKHSVANGKHSVANVGYEAREPSVANSSPGRVGNGRVGNGTERNGRVESARDQDREPGESEFQRRVPRTAIPA